MTNFPDGEQAPVQEEINAIDEPVIGLESVVEYVDPLGEYEPGYLCTICEKRLTPKQVVRHIVTDNHRLKYMVG